ncbi:MAG TPA: hypothetical protein VFV86_05390 [Nitrososphaeraceae archaeon]|nr:hypothetical protein [Nitrososphaeraceae archaeon]
MLLEARELSKYIELSEFSKVNQVGIDLSVQKIEKIMGGVMVLRDKTIVKPISFSEIPKTKIDGYTGWRLESGAYALTFNEKVSVPSDATGFITSRSSIYRGGAHINSPMWDPGFTTGGNAMGTTMIVHTTIFIEENARVGQFYMISNPIPTETYNGQWMNKTNY